MFRLPSLACTQREFHTWGLGGGGETPHSSHSCLESSICSMDLGVERAFRNAEKRKASLLDQLTNTSGTVIGVTSCIVIILIIISVIVQIKQPRKKYVQRKSDFDQTVFQEVFEPPHYELCTLRGTGATADFADVAEDFENYHKLRRSSSKCIHDHHCGSQLSSTKGSRSNLSTRDASVLTEMSPQPVKPLIPPMNRRNILVMKHNYSQDAADACDIDEIEEVPTTSHRLSRHDKAVQRSVSIDFLMTTIT
ncbi:Neuropilin and tolloid-like protein 1, partial [Eschrichtius robustus]|nr:Neuropilin and tolloid-like protein 1 [Eschrichtius robustus]